MALYPEMCGFCFSRPSAHQTEEGIYICGNCNQAIEDIKAHNPNVIDRKRRDPSKLCCKCGICCVVLSAKVEDEEAKTLHQQAVNEGLAPKDYGDVFTIEEIGPNEGDTVFRFPCKYLRGKTLDFVSCAVYGLDRPSVCRSYLCKTAIKYSLNLITIQEAQFTLRSSFLSGDLSLFNWTQPSPDDLDGVEQEISDQKLAFYNHLNEQARRMIDRGAPRELVGMVVSSQITPVLDFKNSACHVLFNMHMAALDRGYIEPRVYVDEGEADSWTMEERTFATRIVNDVLTEIRDLFATKAELGEGEDHGDEPEQEGRDGGEASDEGDQAEGEEQAGDGDDDLDPGGRAGVDDSGQHPRGDRAAEGEGDDPDAASEPHLDPPTGDGSGAGGADEESGEGGTDPVAIGFARQTAQDMDDDLIKEISMGCGAPPTPCKICGGEHPDFEPDEFGTLGMCKPVVEPGEELVGGQTLEEIEAEPNPYKTTVELADRKRRNRKVVDDIIDLLTEECRCPDECPVHDDPRDKLPFPEQIAQPGETVRVQLTPGGPMFEVEAEELARVNQEMYQKWVDSLRASGVEVEDVSMVYVARDPEYVGTLPTCDTCGGMMSHLGNEDWICYRCTPGSVGKAIQTTAEIMKKSMNHFIGERRKKSPLNPICGQCGVELMLHDDSHDFLYQMKHPVKFLDTDLLAAGKPRRIPEDEIVRCGHDHDPCDKVCPECGVQLWSREDYEEDDE